MTKHPKFRHLAASAIGFIAGYGIGAFIEGTFGLHAFLAAMLGNIVVYYAMHYLFNQAP